MTSTPPEAPTGSTEPPQPGPTEPSGPRVTREEAKDLGRIRRSLTDRKIAGVAGGVARHFDIDPLLVRVGFVLLAFFGGGGILAYAAGWLLIPEEGSDEGVIKTDHRTRTVLLAVVGAIAALSLLGDSFGGWEFPWPLAIIGLVVAAIAAATRPKPHPGPLPSHGWIPPGTPGAVPGAQTGYGPSYTGYQPGPKPQPVEPRRRGPLLFGFAMALALVALIGVATADLAGWDAPVSAYPAAVLGTCGVMLLVGAFYGRAGGITFVGLIAALATLVATVVGDVSGQFAGQIDAKPTSAAAVDDRYELTIGEITLDLTEVEDLEALDGRTIEADARIGHIVVVVPADGLDVVVESDIRGAGESVIFGDRTDGSAEGDLDGGTDDEPQVTLDLDVLLGQIEVETKEVA
ncbi:PspC domain-containing protein [Nocardioides sp. HM23]|uniref:PspC domain-containing protein n=1 Tax=Nocardioides bizhenqiangii TaxID=3095076 RepID=UPI002ACA770A|nr:PspC domain-containing protein [Nocardioides sp. HM23]MDZ5621481.1 PspC domain-containing protein [Nocardioides sp. HM23]